MNNEDNFNTKYVNLVTIFRNKSYYTYVFYIKKKSFSSKYQVQMYVKGGLLQKNCPIEQNLDRLFA